MHFGGAVPPTAGEFHGVWAFTLHGFVTLPFWLAVAGIYAVADQVQGALRGLAVQAFLVDGKLKIEKLDG